MAAETAIAKVLLPIVLPRVIEQIENVAGLEERLKLLKTDFGPVKALLQEINERFQEQQRRLTPAIEACLISMSDHLTKGDLLIKSANKQQRWCFGCCLLCNPFLFGQIKDWKTRFLELFEHLVGVVLVSAHTPQIVSDAAPTDVLLQPVPDSAFVGPAIESAQMQLQTWLGEAHPQARMIGVYGMGGVGKTSVLKVIYNNYKEVSGVFDEVIWVTVSQNCQIENLQASIAKALHLKLEGISVKDIRKMELSALLGKIKFLLILDDMWRPIDLIDEVGMQFGDHNCSKVLMSSRSKEVIGMTGASDDYSLEIHTLSTEHSWVLFRREAFTNGVVPMGNIEAIAKKIASECQGLPLALTVVAKAMSLKKTEREWNGALTLMTNADPSFPASHSTIDEKLYKRLRWSYDDLDDHNLKVFFLYCAAFPEDTAIDVERLVEMWSAENSLTVNMDAGQAYIDALVHRGLIEYVLDGQRVKVHDVLRDLAIYIGRTEENCLFAAGQHRQNFPSEDEIRDCKRISVGHNDIQDLPTDLICSKLVSLVLANNEKIREVPEQFLSTAMSLKALDLSHCTSITSLPTSLGQLGQLELLILTACYSLKNLPESIGNLSRLRFLNLEYCYSVNSLPDSIGELRNLKHLNLRDCHSLNSLPDSIGELRNLKHLNLKDCQRLMMIPHGISCLTSLNKLLLPSPKIDSHGCVLIVEDIANLSNLMELELDLTVVVASAIKESTMVTWTNLRRLKVGYPYHADRDDTAQHIFPFNMENVKKLEHFTLHGYKGVSLPNCISQLQNLRTLYLSGCSQLRELPACEIGNGVVGGDFPKLKKLELRHLDKLENMVGLSVVSREETMSELEDIDITYCSSLKRLGTKKLAGLKKLHIFACDDFEALEIGSGGLPMLEELMFHSLGKFQTGPSGVIHDGVMPKLQHLYLDRCGLLKRLALVNLPHLRELSISDCPGLTELEVGSGGFPMFESLYMGNCQNLENIVGPGDAWTDQTMPKFKSLKILGCPLLRRLPGDFPEE